MISWPDWGIIRTGRSLDWRLCWDGDVNRPCFSLSVWGSLLWCCGVDRLINCREGEQTDSAERRDQCRSRALRQTEYSNIAINKLKTKASRRHGAVIRYLGFKKEKQRAKRPCASPPAYPEAWSSCLMHFIQGLRISRTGAISQCEVTALWCVSCWWPSKTQTTVLTLDKLFTQLPPPPPLPPACALPLREEPRHCSVYQKYRTPTSLCSSSRPHWPPLKLHLLNRTLTSNRLNASL